MTEGDATLAPALAAWARGGVGCLPDADVEPGPWSDLLHRAVARARERGEPPPDHCHPSSPLWAVAPEARGVRLAPLDALPDEASGVVLPGDASRLTIAGLLRLRRAGVRVCWTWAPEGWRVDDLDAQLAALIYTRKVRPVARRLLPGVDGRPGLVARAMGAWLAARRTRGGPRAGEDADDQPAAPTVHPVPPSEAAWRATAAARAAPPCDDVRRIVLYIGSLSAGGAERQLCNLAIGLAERGLDVRVLTTLPLADDGAHYLPLLEEAGLEARPARVGPGLPRVRADLLLALPDHLRGPVAALAAELAEDPPDLLHCWLDHPNVIGGLAGLLADVPRILLATRNSAPTNFRYLYAPWLDTWYGVLRASPRVHWLANSHSGARSYADWLGLPVERVHVVLNGLFREHFTARAPDRRRSARAALDIREGAPVVAVVNRLSPEKQPELMLKVVGLVERDLPGLRVLVAGVGPLEPWLRAAIARRRLEDVVRLQGRVRDVTRILAAADCLLLTSRLEGCPNVVLEAQHQGLPVVATAGGGTVDAVLDGETGVLCATDDAVGLALALRRLLRDATLRATLGARARAFVDEAFAVDRMVELTARVYDLSAAGSDERVVTPRPAAAALVG